MLPDRCSIKDGKRRCVNPPEFVISVVSDSEYMIGVVCGFHRNDIGGLLKRLQDEGRIPNGKFKFSPLKSIGTDCIRADPDDLIQL